VAFQCWGLVNSLACIDNQNGVIIPRDLADRRTTRAKLFIARAMAWAYHTGLSHKNVL